MEDFILDKGHRKTPKSFNHLLSLVHHLDLHPSEGAFYFVTLAFVKGKQQAMAEDS